MRARPFPSQWGGGGKGVPKKKKLFDCLGSDLSTHLSNVKPPERGGEGVMWSSKEKAQGFGTRPHTDPG